MRWRSGRRSSNIEDRRGAMPRMGVAGGGLGTIALVLLAIYMGVDPSFLLENVQMSQTQGPSLSRPAPSAGEDDLADFVAVVLGDTEDVWSQVLGEAGVQYQQPVLVLFSGQVQSACGFGSAAMGPFYCPGDQKVYIDLGFYRELRERFQAPGDFAQAYVIAHEVGHHVQNLLGISAEVQARSQRLDEREANQMSVRLELQADCLAGVWANRADAARGILENGDVDEALIAASAIGDDQIQRSTRGQVVPDGFTHGTSAQRSRWFGIGLQTGAVQACDTFAAEQL